MAFKTGHRYGSKAHPDKPVDKAIRQVQREQQKPAKGRDRPF